MPYFLKISFSSYPHPLFSYVQSKVTLLSRRLKKQTDRTLIHYLKSTLYNKVKILPILYFTTNWAIAIKIKAEI